MSVRAHLGIHEESIKYSESLGQSMVVRRNRAREEDERGVSVRLRQITKYLIVCPVLLDDVDDVLEWRV